MLESLLERVLATIGSAAAFTAILAYLTKSVFNQLFKRDIESYKNELKRRTDAELIEAKGRIDREIAETNRKAEAARIELKAEFDREIAEFQAQIANRSAQADRVRTEVEHWANPILGAVRDLHRRLANILERGNPALSRDAKRPIAPGWSLTGEYYRVTTIFLFCQYFCWVRLLEERLRFDLFRDVAEKSEFLLKVRAVNNTLGSWPLKLPPGTRPSPEESDRQVFNLQQRSLGEALIVREGEDERCMRLDQFQERWKDPAFQDKFAPVASLLNGLQETERRWNRLKLTLAALRELDETAVRVLQPPSH